MAYNKYHEAWEDLPSVDTPISAAALDHLEQGIADAQATADLASLGDLSLGDWVDLGNLGATETISGADGVFVRNTGTLNQACSITMTLADNEQAELALEQGGVGEFAVSFVGVDSWTTVQGDPPDTTSSATGDVDFFYFEQIDGVSYGTWSTEPPTAAGLNTSGTPVANDFARFTDENTIEGRSYAEVKADLDLEIGTDVQAYDADLTDIAAISDVQGDIIVRGASGWERLAKSATSTHVLTAGASQPAWSAPAASGAMTLIERKIAGSGGVASFDFTSIPATYESLRLVMAVRSDTGASNTALLLSFNGDTGANYHRISSNNLNGTYSGSPAIDQTSAFVTPWMVAGSATAGLVTAAEMTIPGYARTVFKKTFVANTAGFIDTPAVNTVGGAWLSTAAITRITLTPAAGNLIEGCVVSLYGLGAA